MLSVNEVESQEPISSKSIPYGYTNTSFVEKASFKKIPAKNLDSIIRREESLMQATKYSIATRIGYHNKVSINMTAPAVWKKVEKDDSIARLSFHVENARAVCVLFDKFWLPEGSQLFIYNKQKTHLIEPYNHTNNNGTKTQVEGFCSGLIAGNEVILEYHPPENNNAQAVISLESVVNIYNSPRYLTKKIRETFKKVFSAKEVMDIRLTVR
jgi:hypothetical protein